MKGVRLYWVRMAVFLGLIVALSVVFHEVLIDAYWRNPWLNSVILGVECLSIIFLFRQVLILLPEIRWLQNFKLDTTIIPFGKPKLLRPIATIFRERQGHFLALSPTVSRSLLDSIAARLDDGRDIARYLISLMILLGLLGTFWSLINTVSSVGKIVGELTMQKSDLVAAFDNLKTGLSQPLVAMGMAFSSSLFGLIGSLVLGFLDIQVKQAQNWFFGELEEWLAGLTRTDDVMEKRDTAPSAYIQALLDKTAHSLELLQRTLAQAEERHASANVGLVELTDKLGVLADQMRVADNMKVRLVESQLEIKPLLVRLVDRLSLPERVELDDISRGYLQSIDTQLVHVSKEMPQARDHIVEAFRSEIRLLTRTIATLAEDTVRS